MNNLETNISGTGVSPVCFRTAGLFLAAKTHRRDAGATIILT